VTISFVLAIAGALLSVVALFVLRGDAARLVGTVGALLWLAGVITQLWIAAEAFMRSRPRI